MARVPQIRRTGALSQVAPQASGAGMGWAALADLAKVGADFIAPLAEQQAMERGFERVSRDEAGNLQVDQAHVLGGQSSDIQNAAAYSKYISQKAIDVSDTFTELAQKFQFDPAGFRDASQAYIDELAKDNLPAALKEDVLASARQEQSRRFNGLFSSATDRTYRESDRNTSAHRSMLMDDYVSLYQNGDFEAAQAKLAEIDELNRFRVAAPYISETEAESALLMRGLSGSAKIAYASQRLSNEPFTPELQAEMEEILDDPDISPQQRTKLYGVVQSAIKGVDARGIAQGLGGSSFEQKLIRVESGGDVNAKNPRSTALGPYQFTTDTWRSSVRQMNPEWARGLDEEELQQMRTNPAAAKEVFDHLRAQNAEFLSSVGVPLTEGNEYLAWFLGAPRAAQVLRSDPTADLASIVPSEVIEANPFLEGMNVHDIQQWANRKMTVKASDIALAQNQLYEIEDEELRGMAADELRRLHNNRKNIEDQSLLEYQTRLADGDDLTAREIREDNSLSDAAQNQLIRTVQSARREQAAITETLSRLSAGDSFNIYETDDRNAIDAAFKAVTDGEEPLSPKSQIAAGEIAVQSGILPRTMFNTVRGALNGNDPAAFAAGAEFIGQILSRQPNAIGAYSGRGDVEGRLADYAFYSQFAEAPEAAQRVIDLHSPENQASRRNLSDAAKEAAESLSADDVQSFLSDKGISVSLGTTEQNASLMESYERLFRDAYVQTGDVELAKNRALTDISRVYGPNIVTGNDRLMRYPPQLSYAPDLGAPMGQEYAYMANQIEDAVSEFVFGDEVGERLREDFGGQFGQMMLP